MYNSFFIIRILHSFIESQSYTWNIISACILTCMSKFLWFVRQVWFVCLFVCNVALRPKSTAMVMVGWSVDLTTYISGQA